MGKGKRTSGGLRAHVMGTHDNGVCMACKVSTFSVGLLYTHLCGFPPLFLRSSIDLLWFLFIEVGNHCLPT